MCLLRERLEAAGRALAALIGAGAILLVAFGCSSMEKPGGQERPSWAAARHIAPGSDEFVYAIGTAKAVPDEDAMLGEAQLRARAQLANAIAAYVKEVMGQFRENYSDHVDPSDSVWRDFVNVVSGEVSAAYLRQSLQYESWQDPTDRIFYVVYRIPVSMIHDRMREKTVEVLREINPFGEREKEAQERMDEFLHHRLEQTLKAVAVSPETEPETRREHPAPQWLLEGRHDDYPHEAFLSAIGLGEDLQEARKNACIELSNRIDVHMANTFASIVKSDRVDALARNLRWVSDKTVAFTEKDMVAIEMPKSWHDPVTGTYYALVVQERARVAATCKEKVRAALEQASELSNSARNHKKAGNYLTALQEYLEALALAQQSLKAQVMAMAVQPDKADEFASLTEEASIVEMKKALRQLLREISMEKAGGDNQWTAPGFSLKCPLLVRLTGGQGNKPLAGLPVRFRFAGGTGELEDVVATDEDGIASCTVSKVDRSLEPLTTIVAELDLARLAGDADLTRISPPSVEFTCLLRSKSNSLFAVYVDERTLEGAPAPDALVGDAIEAAMRDNGFALIEHTELLKHVADDVLDAGATEDEMLQAFASLRDSVREQGFLLIVIGRSDAQVVESVKTSKGNLYIVHSPVSVRVIDASLPQDKRRTVLVVNVTGKGAFTDNRVEAVRRARQSAAQMCAQELVNALNEQFGLE